MNIYLKAALTFAILFVAIPLIGGILRMKSKLPIVAGTLCGAVAVVLLFIGLIIWIWE